MCNEKNVKNKSFGAEQLFSCDMIKILGSARPMNCKKLLYRSTLLGPKVNIKIFIKLVSSF